jgi:hypothetical protein
LLPLISPSALLAQYRNSQLVRLLQKSPRDDRTRDGNTRPRRDQDRQKFLAKTSVLIAETRTCSSPNMRSQIAEDTNMRCWRETKRSRCGIPCPKAPAIIRTGCTLGYALPVPFLTIVVCVGIAGSQGGQRSGLIARMAPNAAICICASQNMQITYIRHQITQNTATGGQTNEP